MYIQSQEILGFRGSTFKGQPMNIWLTEYDWNWTDDDMPKNRLGTYTHGYDGVLTPRNKYLLDSTFTKRFESLVERWN